MKKLFIQFTFLLFSLSLTATTVTWNGGSGNWNNPALWSDGMVPNLNDSVVIANNGKVFIPAGVNATVLHLTVNDTLKLRANSFLNILNAPGIGLYNNGLLTNKGTMVFSNTGHDALMNFGKLINHEEGRITINSSWGGIDNEIGGRIKNSGTILIDGISNAYGLDCSGPMINKESGIIDVYNSSGFRQIGLFTNQGTINVVSSSITGLICIGDDFFNELTGTIYIDGCGINGIYINNVLSNQGSITVTNTTSSGVKIYLGTYRNSGRGQLLLSNADTHGIEVSTSSYLINNGYLQIDGTIGINALQLNSGTIENGGELTLNTTMPCSIDATSYFYNHACGTFQIPGAIINDNYFENEGWLRSTFTGSHTNNHLFFNRGVIEDINDSFNGVSINNSAIRIAPLNTAGQVGVPIPDALDLGSLAGFQISSNKWYTDVALTTEAGDYDPALNEFTPTANAAGLNTFYLRVANVTDNCREIFEITITGGVALGPPPPSALLSFNTTTSQDDQMGLYAITLYPNPAVEGFTVKASKPFAQKVSVNIYDIRGQQLLSKTINAKDQTSFYIDLQDALMTGVYLLQIEEEGQNQVSQRLMVDRK